MPLDRYGGAISTAAGRLRFSHSWNDRTDVDRLRLRNQDGLAALAGVPGVNSATVPRPRPLPPRQLVELLKHPLAVKETRRVILDALEATYDRPFADVWEFVAFAEKEHRELDLLSPPQRQQFGADKTDSDAEQYLIDRRAAGYVLSIGGGITIEVRGKSREVGAWRDLPAEPFSLVGVGLRENQKVTDEKLAVFKGCKHLKQLYLFGTPVSDAGLAHFKGCDSLTSLVLPANHSISDAGVANFSECKGLKTLGLPLPKLTDAGVAHFKECRNLVLIGFERSQVTDAGLAHLKECKTIEIIHLDNTRVTDAGMAHFHGCQGITDLGLGWTGVTDAGMVHFKQCKKLTRLYLFGTQVTDAGLANFRDCTDLRSIVLPNHPKITGAGLAHFRGCTGLTELGVPAPQLTDAGLGHLKACRELKSLGIEGSQVTDAGLAELKGCKLVEVLHLDRTRLTDAALASFAEYKQLRRLSLDGTQVTDAGLLHLTGSDSLTELILRNTKVTKDGVNALHKSLPRCRIEWDGGMVEAQELVAKRQFVGRFVWGSDGVTVTISADGTAKASNGDTATWVLNEKFECVLTWASRHVNVMRLDKGGPDLIGEGFQPNGQQYLQAIRGVATTHK